MRCLMLLNKELMPISKKNVRQIMIIMIIMVIIMILIIIKMKLIIIKMKLMIIKI